MKTMRAFAILSYILAFSAAAAFALSSESTLSSVLLASTTPAPATTTTTTTTTTTKPTTNSDESSGSSKPEAEEEEPLTSTVDSLVFNGDEVASTISGADEGATDRADLELDGIEPKSISGSSSNENSLGEPNAKLVHSATGSEPNNTQADRERGDLAPTQSQAAQRNPAHINMSQIDQIYMNAHKDEQETVDSWQRMGKKLKKGIGGLIGSMVPYALNMSQEARISSNCSGAMLKWVLSMNQLKSWALRMLDASGKPVAGLLEGSLTMFGNYRQCLKIRAPDDDEIEFAGEFREYFRGKYCIVQAKPWLPQKSRFYNLNSKLKSLAETEEESQWYDKTVFDELGEWALAFNYVSIRMDVCVPSLCTREDIQKAINFLLRGVDLKARVLRCEMDAAAPALFSSAASVESGSHEIAEALAATGVAPNQVASSPLEPISQLCWILVPTIAVSLVLLATLVSMALDKEEEKTNKLKHTIKSLSLKRSVSSHLNVDYDQLAEDKPLALYGIRFILVLWVILVESAVNLKFEYLRELLMLKDLIFWWPMQFVINSSLQFDSIILLTAFTMSYRSCLNDGVNSAKALTKYIVDKYVRLMPSIMVMVALVILLPLTYRGPVWNDYVTKQSAVCQSTGWLNTVFLQNYLPYKEIVSTSSPGLNRH